MILLRFIGKKYLTYLVGVSLSLAALYTLVEVLEKIARYRDVSVFLMPRYAVIVFIPSFIALFPISALLSSILLLREMLLREYFVLMAVYGINSRRIVGIVGLCSLLAGGGVMLMQEAVGYQLTRHMTRAKVWLFKRSAPSQEWLRLGATSFILGLGNDQSYVLQGGSHPSIAVGSSSPEGARLLTQVNFQTETLTTLYNAIVDLKGLDALTYAAAEVPLRRAIAQMSSRYGQQVVADLLYFFLKIVLLPMFALTYFFLAVRHTVARWVYAGLPYVGLGIGHACSQLIGPLIGIGILFVGSCFLLGYFFSRLR